MRVSASGGAPSSFGTFGAGAVTQRWPQALPGGKGVLFVEHSATRDFDGANLVVVLGGAASATHPIDWMTRDGKVSPLRSERAEWANPRFSPDGQRLALDIADGKQRDIWVYEWARDSLTRLTFDPGDDFRAVWTPDGRRIVFSSDRSTPGTWNLYWVNADGTGEATRLTESPERQIAYSWHPGGRFLAFHANRSDGGARSADLMILPMEGDPARGLSPGKPTVFLSTPATEVTPTFSPDGRWIAYASNESGRGFDVYVRPFPGPGGKWQISTAGGYHPRWSPTSRELLFADRVSALEGQVLFARYSVVGEAFRPEKPQVWSPTSHVTPGISSPYDIHPDGKRLALVTAPEQSGAVVQDKLVFFFGFGEHLKKIAPATK